MTKEEFRKKVVNCTPHKIIFRFPDGEDITIEPSGMTTDAYANEEIMETEGMMVFVKTVFIPSEKGKKEIAEIRTKMPNTIIIGSIISAQAYPGEVFAMTPAPGFERVPPDQKRMNPFKFTMF